MILEKYSSWKRVTFDGLLLKKQSFSMHLFQEFVEGKFFNMQLLLEYNWLESPASSLFILNCIDFPAVKQFIYWLPEKNTLGNAIKLIFKTYLILTFCLWCRVSFALYHTVTFCIKVLILPFICFSCICVIGELTYIFKSRIEQN